MEKVVDFNREKLRRSKSKTDPLTDFDNQFKTLSSNEKLTIIKKAINHFKSIGYKVNSSEKSLDKKIFPAKKTILFKEKGIGFCTSIKKKFTGDSWVIYPIKIESVNGFVELVNFIQKKIEVDKDGRRT